MLTRCPHCQTAFRVTSEQLKVRQGKVRCGSCREVFDALETLADETVALLPAVQEISEKQEAPELVQTPQEILPPEPLPDTPEEIPSAPETGLTEPGPFVEPKAAAEPEPAVAQEAQTATDTEGMAEESRLPQDGAASTEASATQAAEEEMPQAEAKAEADDLAAGEEEVALQEAAVEGVAEVVQSRRWPWLSGIALLLILALGQALFFFRVELAVMAPELRPALAGACEALGCTLPLPRKPELVGIESSDLAPAGADRPGRLQLTAMLKNRAPFDQEYPHLELTLTDTRDEPLLRKVLAPADYLPAEKAAAAGFAAQGEVAVNLALEAEGVPAIGYRLYLFYP